MSHQEQQYLQLIRDILERGHDHHGRNGDTKSLFGNMMRFSLKDGTVPLLTTKKVAWKTCFKELIWFIRGCTDNEDLQKQNVHIWDGNSTREFLDSRGLTNNEEGDLGPVYGHQWRHFNAEYNDRYTDYSGKGIDQLQYIIDNLKTEEGRTSRRLIMSAWNPCQLDQMALPPCHVLAQFNVRSEGDTHYLSCALYQRSCDVGLGVPFNIASYSFLTHLIAKECDLIAEDFVYFMGNTHIYNDHIDALKIQIEREPFSFPRMEIPNKKTLEEYKVSDIVWKEEYKSHETIKMNMSA
jgi:thymidylate synthase